MSALIKKLLVGGLFFLFIAVISSSFYFSRVKFFKPVAIEIKGISINNINDISVWATGPLGTKFFLEKDPVKMVFNGGYAYRKDIVVQLKRPVFEQITEIRFNDGDATNVLPKNTLEKFVTNENPDIQIKVSDFSKGNKSGLLMIFSALLWGGGIRVLYFVLLFIFAFFLGCLFYKLDNKRFTLYAGLLFIILPEKISKQRIRRWLTVLLIIIYSTVFFNLARFSNGAKFIRNDDQYHSAGVNFAKGYGISRIGAIEPFSNYKFTEYGPNLELNYKLFTRFAGAHQFQNPPGYGLFLGIIYFFVGINPLIAKYIQLLLLIIVASLLPMLGYNYWKTKGYVAGLIASAVFLEKYYMYAANLNPQCLLIFMMFFVFYAFDNYVKRKSMLSVILLGLIVALTILVKALIIILPFLIVAWLSYRYYKARERRLVLHLLVFFAAFVLPFVPWSIYATRNARQSVITSELLNEKLINTPLSVTDSAFLMPIINNDPSLNSKKTLIDDAGIIMDAENCMYLMVRVYGRSMSRKNFVFISTQADKYDFLYAHNEFIENGGFNEGWIMDKNSFYNNDGLRNYPPLLRIINFYYHFPLKIFTLPFSKLYAAFSHYAYLWSLGLLFLVNFLGDVIFKERGRTKRQYIFLIIALLISFVPLVLPINKVIFGIIIFLTLLIAVIKKRERNLYHFVKPPLSIILIVLSFILFTILGAGDIRFTEIIDFVFILVSTYGFVAFFSKWSGIKQMVDQQIKERPT